MSVLERDSARVQSRRREIWTNVNVMEVFNIQVGGVAATHDV